MPIVNFTMKPSLAAAEIVSPDGRRQRAVVNEAETALLWLAKRKGPDGAPLISAFQFAAGEKLREDYTYGHMGARVTAAWDAQVISGSHGREGISITGASDRVIAAKARFAKAVDAVGPELSGILVQVCCLSAGIEQAERAMNLPVRSGKAILGLALTRLARHYGLIGRETPRRMGHSGIAGYRPAVTPAPPGHPAGSARSSTRGRSSAAVSDGP